MALAAAITAPRTSAAQTTSVPVKRDVRVHVGHTAEDGVVLKQLLESADIQAHREEQQQKCERDGEAAPRQWNVAVVTSVERPRAARHKDKENGEHTGNHRHATAAIR